MSLTDNKLRILLDSKEFKHDLQGLKTMMDGTVEKAKKTELQVRTYVSASLSLISTSVSIASSVFSQFATTVPQVIAATMASVISTMTSVASAYFALAAATENPVFAAQATAVVAVIGAAMSTMGTIQALSNESLRNLVTDFVGKMNWALGTS